jgi:hypothetical protein
MAPNLVFAGTLSELAAFRRSGVVPAVLVLTYAALGRANHGQGEGFDPRGIERFLQANDVRHVILDEVHRVAADLYSNEANCVRVFREWLGDGSLTSLIGFSGTLIAFRRQLNDLGLELSYILPATELIARGWVAPFAEFGAPFNLSEREREVSNLVAEYKALLIDYLRRIGTENLREWFCAVPFDERLRLARGLGMYAGRRDVQQLIGQRLQEWEIKSQLGLNEILVLPIVQIANKWSDRELLTQSAASGEFSLCLQRFESIRSRLITLLPPGRLTGILGAPGLGHSVPPRTLMQAIEPRREHVDQAREALATTFAGTYLALRSWSRQAGEGRVSTVRSIVASERESRKVTAIIVFDKPAG